MRVIGIVVLVSLLGCSEEIEDAKQAAAAAKGLVDMAKGAKQMAEAAEKAAAEAELAAQQDTEGMDPAEAKQQIDMAKGLAAMKAMQQAAGGPAINWRQLTAFLPDKLGDFESAGEFKGSTNKTGGFEVTVGKRNYKVDKRRLEINITDAFTSPMLRAPFAMAAMVDEDSSDGYKKGKQVKGHSAIVEWKKGSKRSRATLLVADRFMLEVKVSGTETPDEAEQVAALLDLEALAKLKPEAPEEQAPKEQAPAE